MGETKDHKYCWNLFSGDRDHVTALSGDHIISETKTKLKSTWKKIF